MNYTIIRGSRFAARFHLAATTFAIRLRKDYGGQEATVVKKDAKIAKCRGDYGADEIKLPRKLPRWLRPFNTMLIQLIIYRKI